MAKDIEQRSAGRALDAEIAERVLGAFWYPTESGSPTEEALAFKNGKGDPGWSLAWRYSNGKPTVYKSTLPNYSCDFAAAFQVVEAMRAKGWLFQCRVGAVAYCGFLLNALSFEEAEGDTLPLAICLAALKALDAEQSPTISAVENPSIPSPSSTE